MTVKPKYDLQALKDNVAKIEANIERLKGGIKTEEDHKMEILFLIREIENEKK